MSRINANEESRLPYLFQELTFDGNDRFNISMTIVQSGPVTHTYYFQLIENKWFLAREERNELARCGEGDDAEMSDSLQVATNYLTGKIVEQRYSEKDCKPLKLLKKKRKFSLVSLSDFYPFMEIEPQQ